mmetsp:Transcript_13569/g.42489  ORF Transcript_13569/g.42489 Transcript_13569/m.42489 type:complete len:294 (-) Transcript_13569:464-1345(-)
MMSHDGRYLEMSRPLSPVPERVRIALHPRLFAAVTAAIAVVSFVSVVTPRIVFIMSERKVAGEKACSASRQMAAIVVTACSGYAPFAVSPDSITQSAPSSTAFATSDTSARVGRGLEVIDSSICVAQMIGLPARLHLAIIIFCATKTLCAGISMPRSPRATITPSVTARISSKLRMPSWFSILEMILTWRPLAPSASRTASTSEPLRMKEAKIMSTSCSTPHLRSALSFSESAGKSTFTSGKLQPFRLPSAPELTTRHLSESPSCPFSSTSSEMRPSSTKMTLPTSTTLTMFL